jgi:hypothetical protein
MKTRELILGEDPTQDLRGTMARDVDVYPERNWLKRLDRNRKAFDKRQELKRLRRLEQGHP